jgi:polyisoprenoid-binding protein YceI
MRTILFVIICLLSTQTDLVAQKYSTKSGEINFEASVPSFEEVKATNTNVSAILTEAGDLASLALVNAFRFKVALMQEHFNENYAESDKYPKTTFRGKLEGFSMDDLSETEATYNAVGVINLHGVDKNVNVPVQIKKVDENIVLTTQFILKPGDFNIEIPSIVSNKIAEEVNVSATFNLSN